MKKGKIIFTAIIALLVLGGLFFVFYKRKNAVLPKQDFQQPAKNGTTLETQKNENGPVSIEITPQGILKDASAQWRFKVVLDSHSAELVEDMVKVAVLADDKGNSYQPLAWEGDAAGGHHREGFLVFNALDPLPKSIGLRIINVGNVANRSFVWQLK